MIDNRTVASGVTAGIAILLVCFLYTTHLSFDAKQFQKAQQITELVEMEEEFVDLLEAPPIPSNPAPAYTPTPQRHNSKAAEASGADIRNSGAKGASVPDVSSKRPSELKRPEPKPDQAPAGPSESDLQAEARRQARQGISDAFKAQPNATDNTTAKGSGEGDSGKPSGTSSALDGVGNGSVGGGWIMPRFGKVPSAYTGRVELRAIINREGHVISVEQTGGKAPAGTDSRIVARCIAEVKSRRFTRSDDNAPDRATATITYIFR